LITYCSIAKGVWNKHKEWRNINIVTVHEFSDSKLQLSTLMKTQTNHKGNSSVERMQELASGLSGTQKIQKRKSGSKRSQRGLHI